MNFFAHTYVITHVRMPLPSPSHHEGGGERLQQEEEAAAAEVTSSGKEGKERQGYWERGGREGGTLLPPAPGMDSRLTSLTLDLVPSMSPIFMPLTQQTQTTSESLIIF